MPTAESSQPVGFFERAVTRFLMQPGRVAATTSLSENFRLIDFEGDALKGCDWARGDKIQIKLDGGLTTRTYTPITWDKAAGTTRILAYSHVAGPGSTWAHGVAVGGERQIFGPRRSLDLGNISASTIVFGDETSFGLAVSLQQGAAEPHFVFEVNGLAESVPILEKLGVASPTVTERRPDDGHLRDVMEAILRRAGKEATFILSGKAPSIQHVSRSLKALDIDTRRLRSKAYWAPGKVGLD